MRIGVTSQNFRTITAHAGRARRFMIFEDLLDGQVQETGKLDLPLEMSLHEYPRHAPHPIDGLDVLITGSCGEGFSNKLAARGIRVIVTSETDPMKAIAALLSGAALPPPVEEEEHGGCECHCAGGGNR
jgi:predicted Fe-Mo cluster-binding NifX family protein